MNPEDYNYFNKTFMEKLQETDLTEEEINGLD